MLPVVTTKSSEVYYWGGGKVTPQKIDIFQKARSAIQVRPQIINSFQLKNNVGLQWKKWQIMKNFHVPAKMSFSSLAHDIGVLIVALAHSKLS